VPDLVTARNLTVIYPKRSEPALRYAELDAGAMILDVFKEELMDEILRELKSAGLCAQSLKDAIGA